MLDKDRIRAGLFPPSHRDYTANQIATLRRLAADLGEPLRVIECTCDDQLARNVTAVAGGRPVA